MDDALKVIFSIRKTQTTGPLENVIEGSLSLKRKKKKNGKKWTQSPTTTNYAAKFPTFGEIARISISSVKHMSCTLEKPPSCRYLPCQANIESRVFMKLKIMFTKPRLIKIFLILIYISSVLEIQKTFKYYSIIPQDSIDKYKMFYK